MILYEEAISAIQKAVHHLPVVLEKKPIQTALNEINRQPVLAPNDYPAFRNSAMDGYAIHTSWKGTTFPMMQEELFAGGQIPSHLLTNHALYITTGAVVPEGYNAVIPIEHCSVHNQLVTIDYHDVPKNLNIRLQGSDFKKGDVLLPVQARITPNVIMVLATAGIRNVYVKKKLRYVLITTGDEVVTGVICDSTGPYLTAQLQDLHLVQHHIVSDNEKELNTLLMHYIDNVDLIITTGAVSMGKKDYIPPIVRDIIQKKGGKEIFHKVAIRPGKPQYFARLGSHTLLCGLPGNPVSVAVGYTFFIQILLHAYEHTQPPYLKVSLAHEYHTHNPRFAYFLKGKQDDENRVHILQGQESYRVSPLINTNMWVMLPPSSEVFPENYQATCLPVPLIHT